jgi:hypothetical protein
MPPGFLHFGDSPPREEGWLRHQENFGEVPLNAADGVVAHKTNSGVSDVTRSSAISAGKHHPDAVSRTQRN